MADDGDHDEREAQDEAVSAYWDTARKRAGLTRLGGIVGPEALSTLEPPAWSFGASPEEADELLALVLAGTKTATSSAAAPYAELDEPVPVAGDLSIILDGHGRPRALVVTIEVSIVALRDVDDEHAAAEGEGQGTLAQWRETHEAFLREELAGIGRELDDASEVVLERFRLLDPRPPRSAAATADAPAPDPSEV